MTVTTMAYKNKRLMTVINPTTYETLQSLASAEKRTISNMVEVLLCEAIEARQKKEQ